VAFLEVIGVKVFEGLRDLCGFFIAEVIAQVSVGDVLGWDIEFAPFGLEFDRLAEFPDEYCAIIEGNLAGRGLDLGLDLGWGLSFCGGGEE